MKPNLVELGTALAGFALLVYGMARLSIEGAFMLAGAMLLAGALSQRKTN